MLFLLFQIACLPEFDINPKNYVDNPTEDFDQDGVTETDGDCDDNDDTRFPGNTESCDSIDNDCDGTVDEEATDAPIWYLDVDGDGFGRENFLTQQCDAPEGYILVKTDADGNIIYDCNDDDYTISPNAPEVCDTVDNDCDGDVDFDDDDFTGDATWFLDSDGDGYGNPEVTIESCNPEEPGYVKTRSDLERIDCNDADPTINPSAIEVCDEIDNDCDDLIDDADTGSVPDRIWTVDGDGDGFGDASSGADTVASCAPVTGYSPNNLDCDDGDINTHPDAAEVCDNVDQNCNNLVDEGTQVPWYVDMDGDGYGATGVSPTMDCVDADVDDHVLIADDCDDTDPNTHLNADEICDGEDNNCNSITDENSAVDAPTWYLDSDADGFGDPAVTFVSCNQPQGYVANLDDCDDLRIEVNPDAQEDCNFATIDENCNGSTNDVNALNCTVFYQDLDGDGYGEQAISQCSCEALGTFSSLAPDDCDDSKAFVNPDAQEVCDDFNVDEDCDGDSNDLNAGNCNYYFYDYDVDTFGTDNGLCQCVPYGLYTAEQSGDCNDLISAINPDAEEVCDDFDVDEDCSGVADDAGAIDATLWYADVDGDGYGDDATEVLRCDALGYISQGGDCQDGLVGVNPAAQETCFTQYDDDCSGSTNDDGAIGCTDYFGDVDGDGYGDAGDSQCLCITEGIYTSVVDTDCDDSDLNVNPGELEYCSTSGIDDDCDGSIDENGAADCTVFFMDSDGDSYGVGTDYQCQCAPTIGYSAFIGGDCDDSNASLSPNIDPSLSTCGLFGDVSTSAVATTFIDQGYTDSITRSNFDYNNDGYLDIVSLNKFYDTDYTDAGAVFVFLGPIATPLDNQVDTDADLIFTPEIASAGLTDLIVMNVDGDPEDEIIVERGNGEYYLIDNGLTGMGVLTNNSSVISMIDMVPDTRTSGDFNGDGVIDEVVGKSDYLGPNESVAGAIWVQYGTQGVPFASEYVGIALAADDVFYGVAPLGIRNDNGETYDVVDIDNDGIDDLIAQTSVFLGSSTGLIPSPVNQYNRKISSNNMFDLNGDGVDEYILEPNIVEINGVEEDLGCGIYDPVTDTVTLSDYNDNTEYYAGSSWTRSKLLPGYHRCTVGDINNDGFYDFISGDPTVMSDYDGWVKIFLGDSSGTFDLTNSTSDLTLQDNTFQFGNAMYVSDLNTDGIDDIVTYRGSGVSYGSSHLSTFIFGNEIPSNIVVSRVPGPAGFGGDWVYDIILLPGYLEGFNFDFNNDGIREVLVYAKISTFSWFLLDFNTLDLYPLSGTPLVFDDDINGDGFPDIISIQNGLGMHIYYGNSNFDLGSPQTITGTIYDIYPLYDATLLDYNNDGEQDIVIKDPDGMTKGLFLSLLSNTFQWPFATSCVVEGSIDFTEDGVEEVICKDANNDILYIYDSVQDIVKSYTFPSHYIEIEATTEYNFIGDMSNDLVVKGIYNSSNSSNYRHFNLWVLEGNNANSFVDNLHQWTDAFLAGQNLTFNNIRDYDGDGYYSLGTFASGSPTGFIEDLRNTTNGYDDKLIFFDADGDGHSDLIRYNSLYDYYDQFQGTLTNSGLVEVVLSSTGEVWQYRGDREYQTGNAGIQTADINGDGLNDLYISHYRSGSKASLFYAPLTIPTDTQGNSRPLTPQDADAHIPASLGGHYPSFSMEDFNNDGYDDIWVYSDVNNSYTSTHALYHGAPN